MAKKILVAGAGIGGLVAAAKLAEKGYDVTVCAENTPEAHGYDWEDSVDMKILAPLLGKKPEEIEHGFLSCMSFHNPSESMSLNTKGGGTGATKIERRLLSSLLLDFAGIAGVRFVWKTRVLSAVTQQNRVTGIHTQNGTVYADMVIDACGVYSAVRQSLPAGCKIERHTSFGEVFCAYRGIFEKNGTEMPEYPYEFFLVHEGEQGISWLITEENSVDILIGRFEPFGFAKVDKTLAFMREKHPQLGEKLLRGGRIAAIPVRRPAPKFVCDGYAAVGDSAFMTYPMSGSGVDISLQEGCCLADVIDGADGDYSTEKLWAFNRDYIRSRADILVGADRLKNVLLNTHPRDLDFMFEKRIITTADVASDGSAAGSPKEMLGKAIRGIPKLDKLIRIVRVSSGSAGAAAVYKSVPENYSDEAFDTWKKNVDATVIPLRKVR